MPFQYHVGYVFMFFVNVLSMNPHAHMHTHTHSTHHAHSHTLAHSHTHTETHAHTHTRTPHTTHHAHSHTPEYTHTRCTCMLIPFFLGLLLKLSQLRARDPSTSLPCDLPLLSSSSHTPPSSCLLIESKRGRSRNVTFHTLFTTLLAF